MDRTTKSTVLARDVCIDVCMHEYAYWKMHVDKADDNGVWDSTAIGAMCAAANILAGVIRQELLPHDSVDIASAESLRRRAKMAEVMALGGGLDRMVDELCAGLAADYTCVDVDKTLLQSYGINTDARTSTATAGLDMAKKLVEKFKADLNEALGKN